METANVQETTLILGGTGKTGRRLTGRTRPRGRPRLVLLGAR
jgi:hypothetical protein